MRIIIISTEARLYHVVNCGFDEDVELSSCFFGPYRQCLYHEVMMGLPEVALMSQFRAHLSHAPSALCASNRAG